MREAYNSGFEDMETLRLRFEEFRSRHARRTRLLEELWRAAAEIAERRGINVVARSLRLDTNSLRKWMGQGLSARPARRKPVKRANAQAFVEMFAPAAAGGASNCMLEVESPQGAKLRLEWKAATSSELTQLIRAFAGSKQRCRLRRRCASWWHWRRFFAQFFAHNT